MIRKRGNKFTVTVYDRRVKRKVWVGTYATEQEAKVHEEMAAAYPHIPGYGEDTCKSFADRWPRDFPRPAVATRNTYRYALVRFVDRFGPLRLIELDRPTCYQWALTEPYGTAVVCRNMLNDAINAGLFRGPNPFANLRRPKSKGRRDIDVMNADELDELVALATRCHGEFGETMMGPMIEFQAYVTTRPAEMYFIERSDVRGDEVYVIDADDSTGNPKEPKNGIKRKVILPPPAAEAIARIPPRIDVPWLFYTKTGLQFNKGTLFYWWNPIRKAFGRPDLDFYDLRHYGGAYMTNVLHAPPEVTAIQMGHRDHGRLIRELYGHKDEADAREELKRLYRERYHRRPRPARGDSTSRQVYDPTHKGMRWVGSYPTEAEAEAAEARAGLYATRWLELRPRPAAGTRAKYARAVERFLDRFGLVELDRVDPGQVREWALTQPTDMQSGVQAMFSDAIRDGAYPGPSPLRGISGARVGGRRPGHLSVDELDRLAECAVEAWGEYGLEVLAPAILTTGYAQLTRSELFNLRPGDLDGTTLHVQRGEHRDAHRLPEELADALAARSEIRAEWMFETITGRKLSEGTHYRYWSAIRIAFGRPDMHFHEVRLDHDLS